LRRGLYAQRNHFDRYQAASLIYAPSYISFETALEYYGLIPERVETIMSVVDGRPKVFHTPLGLYEYVSQSRTLFAMGMGMQFVNDKPILIATKEKAILDTLMRVKLQAKTLRPKDIVDYLLNNLRIDIEDIQKLSKVKLSKMAPYYRNHAPRKLVAYLKGETDL